MHPSRFPMSGRRNRAPCTGRMFRVVPVARPLDLDHGRASIVTTTNEESSMNVQPSRRRPLAIALGVAALVLLIAVQPVLAVTWSTEVPITSTESYRPQIVRTGPASAVVVWQHGSGPLCPPHRRRRTDLVAGCGRRNEHRCRLVRGGVGQVRRPRVGSTVARPGRPAPVLPPESRWRRDLAAAQGPDLGDFARRRCGGGPPFERAGQRGLHRTHERPDLHPHEHQRRYDLRGRRSSSQARTTPSRGGSSRTARIPPIAIAGGMTYVAYSSDRDVVSVRRSANRGRTWSGPEGPHHDQHRIRSDHLGRRQEGHRGVHDLRLGSDQGRLSADREPGRRHGRAAGRSRPSASANSA